MCGREVLGRDVLGWEVLGRDVRGWELQPAQTVSELTMGNFLGK
jgi:hypothetical protein